MSVFFKDAWIRDALRKGYLKPHRNGDIWRCDKADEAGNLLVATYHKITLQIHKPSGRVYFTMTWRGITKSVGVPRVIAWAYHPNPQNLPQVDHKDGNKLNNTDTNLEWVTGGENERRAHATGLKTGRGTANSNAKLTPDSVLAIRASTEKPEDIAKTFGVSRSTIISIKAGRTWRHL